MGVMGMGGLAGVDMDMMSAVQSGAWHHPARGTGTSTLSRRAVPACMRTDDVRCGAARVPGGGSGGLRPVKGNGGAGGPGSPNTRRRRRQQVRFAFLRPGFL